MGHPVCYLRVIENYMQVNKSHKQVTESQEQVNVNKCIAFTVLLVMKFS